MVGGDVYDIHESRISRMDIPWCLVEDKYETAQNIHVLRIRYRLVGGQYL